MSLSPLKTYARFSVKIPPSPVENILSSVWTCEICSISERGFCQRAQKHQYYGGTASLMGVTEPRPAAGAGSTLRSRAVVHASDNTCGKWQVNGPIVVTSDAFPAACVFPSTTELQDFQDFGQFGCSHGFFPTDFLQRVLIDSPAHKFALWKSCDAR
jgi:hypothetical protein